MRVEGRFRGEEEGRAEGRCLTIHHIEHNQQVVYIAPAAGTATSATEAAAASAPAPTPVSTATVESVATTTTTTTDGRLARCTAGRGRLAGRHDQAWVFGAEVGPDIEHAAGDGDEVARLQRVEGAVQAYLVHVAKRLVNRRDRRRPRFHRGGGQ